MIKDICWSLKFLYVKSKQAPVNKSNVVIFAIASLMKKKYLFIKNIVKNYSFNVFMLVYFCVYL